MRWYHKAVLTLALLILPMVVWAGFYNPGMTGGGNASFLDTGSQTYGRAKWGAISTTSDLMETELMTPSEVGSTFWAKMAQQSVNGGSARKDQVVSEGWNNGGNNSIEPQFLAYSIESYYSPGAVAQSEAHYAPYTRNAVQLRPIDVIIPHDTETAQILMKAGSATLGPEDGSTAFRWTSGGISSMESGANNRVYVDSSNVQMRSDSTIASLSTGGNPAGFTITERSGSTTLMSVGSGGDVYSKNGSFDRLTSGQIIIGNNATSIITGIAGYNGGTMGWMKNEATKTTVSSPGFATGSYVEILDTAVNVVRNGNTIASFKVAGAFSGLPSCTSSIEGRTASVTDSTTNVWGATITGSGANHVLAYCDGTNWTVAGK